jgi:aquaporin Z
LNKKLIVECLGTFILCLIIALNKNAGTNNVIAICATLIGLIYAGGHISGAHYNPVVSLANLLIRTIEKTDCIKYVLAQLLGGVLAAVTAKYIFKIDTAATPQCFEIIPAIGAEIIGTAVMVLVILNVAHAPKLKGNSFYGLAIGLVILGLASILGQYSGAAFNPLVALCQCLLNSFAFSQYWLYFFSTIGGALIAVYIYKKIVL